MKGDNTRFTFEKKKHYSGVRMQQGRVQLDADWNEQAEIAVHRIETETVDSVGRAGAPMYHGGFHLFTDGGDLTVEELGLPENSNPPVLPAGDFYISGGRCYVDGVLCENERIVPFSEQPDALLGSLPADFPDLAEISSEISPPDSGGTYLAYLDAWTRHITALEDPEIRETALGGPDTATRTKTVWQVKLLRVGDENANVHCLSDLPEWNDLVRPPDGKLAARAEESETLDEPCRLAPGAGYRRLENQLYRVEVHTGGGLGDATFKWSRDNGSIVAKWENQDPADHDKITVSGANRDKTLNFASGQWIELTDDARELLGRPGTLVRLARVEGGALTMDSSTATGPVDLANFPVNPKVRRWDSDGSITPTDSEYIELEEGVRARFTNGSYKAGDYWLIPARTTAADVEWPIDDATGEPALRSPHGIDHHYCRLALLRRDETGLTVISDCRNIFPPATELTSLLYVGGNGQMAMPGSALDAPLRVRVVNGRHPEPGARVRFTIEDGGGALSTHAVETAEDGVAGCDWTLGPSGKQRVKAELLDAGELPVAGQTIRFNADLSVAAEVAYDPSGCEFMGDSTGAGAGAQNVQDAIDRLCPVVTLAMLCGDGQEARVGENLPRDLRVAAFWGNVPLEGDRVIFTVLAGDAEVDPEAAEIDPDGVARCTVSALSLQKGNIIEVAAVLEDAPAPPKPPELVFTANFINADQVYVNEGVCPDMDLGTGSRTVAELLEHLCQQGSGPEPAIRIEKILRYSSSQPVDLMIDDVLPVQDFVEGVVIVCDAPIDPDAVDGRAVGSVRLELPYPLNGADQELWGKSLLGFKSIIIDGGFSVAADPEDNQRGNHAIVWKPNEDAKKWLGYNLFPVLDSRNMGAAKLLIRLDLNGNLIWGQKDPQLRLDADLFARSGAAGVDPIRPERPGGDGRRGGVLNTRFWIEK